MTLAAIDSLDLADEIIKVSTRHHRIETLLASTNEELTEIFTRLYERLEPEFAEISKLQWLV